MPHCCHNIRHYRLRRWSVGRHQLQQQSNQKLRPRCSLLINYQSGAPLPSFDLAASYDDAVRWNDYTHLRNAADLPGRASVVALFIIIAYAYMCFNAASHRQDFNRLSHNLARPAWNVTEILNVSAELSVAEEMHPVLPANHRQQTYMQLWMRVDETAVLLWSSTTVNAIMYCRISFCWTGWNLMLRYIIAYE